MKDKTPIQELIPAYRQWVKQWDLYDEYKNPLMTKPPNIDEFIAPFLEKEKDMVLEAMMEANVDKSYLLKHIEWFESKYGK